MDAAIISKLLYEYETDRQNAKLKRQKRLEKLYESIPELEELDRELTNAGASAASAILHNPSNGQHTAQSLKQHINSLLALRITLLRQHGYPENYTDLEYKCAKCQDTGYIGSKKCSCLEQKLIDEASKNSNLSKLFDTQDFANFDFSYYSKEVDPKEGVSPYSRMKEIYEAAYNFATRFDDVENNLLLYGDVGLGKTFLSSAIAKTVLNQGKTVIYQSASRLFSNYGDYIFSRTDTKEARPQIQRLFDVDLLIIDDLGTEAVSTYTTSFLFELINERVLTGKKTIISTNLVLGELPKIYSSRLHSRILEHFATYKLIGRDIRQQKAMRR